MYVYVCVCVCAAQMVFCYKLCKSCLSLCYCREFLSAWRRRSLSLSLSLTPIFIFIVSLSFPLFFWIKELVVCRMDMALVSFLKKTAEEQVPGQRVVTPNLPPAVTTWEEEGSRGNWRRRSSKATTFRMVYLLSTTTTVDYSLVCLMTWDSLVFATGLLCGFWVVLVFLCVCVCVFFFT